ncbi:MAG: 50S ribosomal protein L11 methyltransferase [Christensenellaceae bacterium]|nr:50S ribosomal protein L11 methyltransferase [Christensenellaceae bacterium]
MKWVKVIVHTSTEGQDIVSDLLMRQNAVGTEIKDRKDIPNINNFGLEWELYDESLINAMPEDVEVYAWFDLNSETNEKILSIKDELKTIKQNDSLPLGTLDLEIEYVDDEDWSNVWKQYYKPFRVGKNIVVKPSWEDYERQENDIVIELDPGMAFGTGSHATTHMCLELLEKYVSSDKAIMDIGTGSGILAICCALLGAKKILALDINADAVRIAKENVDKNGLNEYIKVVQSDLLKSESINCDIAVANIIADAVIMLMPSVKNSINKNGLFIVSGILKDRKNDVLKEAEKLSFTLLDTLSDKEWVALVFKQES